MKKLLFALCLLYFCCPGFSSALLGNNAQTIKQNMLQRLPRITELKKLGLVGENRQGFLEAVKDKPAADDLALLEAENADRKAVYEAIARQQGTTVELVGQLRAKKIYEQAKSGEFLKQEDGSWTSK